MLTTVVVIRYILKRDDLVRWFVDHGADPNAQSEGGLTPFLRALGHESLSTVKLLHSAGGSSTIGVPFVCSPEPRDWVLSLKDKAERLRVEDSDERLSVLRYIIDAGANVDAPKWAHNSRGYASDVDFGNALNWCLADGKQRLAQELLRRGARTDIPTRHIASQEETAVELAEKHCAALLPLVLECRQAHLGVKETS